MENLIYVFSKKDMVSELFELQEQLMIFFKKFGVVFKIFFPWENYKLNFILKLEVGTVFSRKFRFHN